MAYNFTTIERKWQEYWLNNKTFAALDPAEAGDRPKAYILDMFPYPSGAGLHVGHPEGYTATDIISRYLRMQGVNVLHPMGWDAFGLPAEQYAIKTNTHPRVTTEQNITNFRRQIQMLGLSYDWDREVDTTDPTYYRWTQWIFLQLFNSYFDPIQQRAMPIGHLMNELVNENYVIAPDSTIRTNPVQEGTEQVLGEVRIERLWRELRPEEQQEFLDSQRLAYMDEIPVNWCPALGTVLANEEVIDGRSEVGGFPVERRPLRQWMLRITAYADRLLEDLEGLDWPESLKEMQRNWIGRSVGAEVNFSLDGAGEDDEPITVFTTRPDTLYGATYMVLAPEHPLVDRIATAEQRAAVAEYRAAAAGRSERDRMAGSKEKTGCFTGAYAINPVNNHRIPIHIADYVLMSYGTGAIMAVPAHDERDFEYARKFKLPIRAVVMPEDAWLKENARGQENGDAAALRLRYMEDAGQFATAYTGDGRAVQSPLIDGLATPAAKDKIIAHLEMVDDGRRSIKYKLRDWLFSRQRYWGEPIPILLDAEGNPASMDGKELPLTLPEMDDFKPTGTPEPPLSKAAQWLRVERDGEVFSRETNTMPQWAGSCWYYLRYIDPKNPTRLVDPAKEKYWMPVDLYVGGVEHAVLHLLYSRFWHKVLFDLGHVSTAEPFQRLVNQGLILGETEYHVFEDESGKLVSTSELRDIAEEATPQGTRLVGYHRQTGQRAVARRVEEKDIEKAGEGYRLRSDPAIRVDARSFKMSKSRGNVVNPDEIVREYGADCFRLYEMYMGPLEAPKPWNTRDIVGMYRFLKSVWRNLIGEEEESAPATAPAPAPALGETHAPAGAHHTRVVDGAIPEALDRQMNRTIKKVGEDITAMRFNTGIAELIKLNNEMSSLPGIPRKLAESFVLLLAPFAPHIAEELWERLGHHKSLAQRPWPTFDPEKLVESTIELPVQVNGKLRDRVTVPADAEEATILQTAEAAEKVRPWLEGKTVVKRLYVPKKLVNIVVK